MNRLPRSARLVLFALAIALCAAVCHQRLIPIIPMVSAAAVAAQDQDQTPPDQGQDPAAGNLAPSGPSYTTQAPPPAGRRPLRVSPPTNTVNSPQKRQPRLLLRCPSTISHRRPPTATSGLPAIGPGARLATTGCPARGSSHPTRARSGRLAIGVSTVAAMVFIPATGACTSASTAASTTALATSASATRAAIGIPATSSTTASTTTWTHG